MKYPWHSCNGIYKDKEEDGYVIKTEHHETSYVMLFEVLCYKNEICHIWKSSLSFQFLFEKYKEMYKG